MLDRRTFLKSVSAAAALPALGGARTPNLVFGILSDMHVTTPETCEHLEKALTYFKAQGVDAVVFAGDLIDDGLESELALVAETWYRVFPEDKGLGGCKVEKLFVYGNHDVQNYTKEWADEIKIPWEKVQREDLALGTRRKDVFERLFREAWRPLLKNYAQEHHLLVNAKGDYELVPYDMISDGLKKNLPVRAFIFEKDGSYSYKTDILC